MFPFRRRAGRYVVAVGILELHAICAGLLLAMRVAGAYIVAYTDSSNAVGWLMSQRFASPLVARRVGTVWAAAEYRHCRAVVAHAPGEENFVDLPSRGRASLLQWRERDGPAQWFSSGDLYRHADPTPRGYEIGEARTSPDLLDTWSRHVGGLASLGFDADPRRAWTYGEPTDERLACGDMVSILDTSTGTPAELESVPVPPRLPLGECDYAYGMSARDVADLTLFETHASVEDVAVARALGVVSVSSELPKLPLWPTHSHPKQSPG